MLLPKMLRLRQHFQSPPAINVVPAVREELAKLRLDLVIRPGQTVAITAGSRGIAQIDLILKTVVQVLRELGAEPFLVPAMGSHGGGTVEGQLEVLREYGITPEAMNCEIRATMDTVVVDQTPHGVPVHFDAIAAKADHVLICNRVKPHTGFVGEVESGLHKMMLIGLGKHAGASIYHRAIADHSFMDIVTAVGASVIRKCRVVGGLAIVENAHDQTALIASVPPAEFLDREQVLLRQAIDWLPRLPFPECDLLIVDRIGKNFSGTGMDTNVVGRKYSDHAATERDRARCRRIFVRGLTPETHGNASGIGLSEFTNTRTVRSIDSRKTSVNCLTALHPTAAMVPIAFDTDREVVEAALLTIGLRDPVDARVIQIANTLHLQEVEVSEAYRPLLDSHPSLEIIREAEPMAFDADGNLVDVQPLHA